MRWAWWRWRFRIYRAMSLVLAHHLSPRLQRHGFGNGSPRLHHRPELRVGSGRGVGWFIWDNDTSLGWGRRVGVDPGVVLRIGLVFAHGQHLMRDLWSGSVCGVGDGHVQCVWCGNIRIRVGVVGMQCMWDGNIRIRIGVVDMQCVSARCKDNYNPQLFLFIHQASLTVTIFRYSHI